MKFLASVAVLLLCSESIWGQGTPQEALNKLRTKPAKKRVLRPEEKVHRYLEYPSSARLADALNLPKNIVRTQWAQDWDAMVNVQYKPDGTKRSFLDSLRVWDANNRKKLGLPEKPLSLLKEMIGSLKSQEDVNVEDDGGLLGLNGLIPEGGLLGLGILGPKPKQKSVQYVQVIPVAQAKVADPKTAFVLEQPQAVVQSQVLSLPQQALGQQPLALSSQAIAYQPQAQPISYQPQIGQSLVGIPPPPPVGSGNRNGLLGGLFGGRILGGAQQAPPLSAPYGYPVPATQRSGILGGLLGRGGRRRLLGDGGGPLGLGVLQGPAPSSGLLGNRGGPFGLGILGGPPQAPLPQQVLAAPISIPDPAPISPVQPYVQRYVQRQARQR